MQDSGPNPTQPKFVPSSVDGRYQTANLCSRQQPFMHGSRMYIYWGELLGAPGKLLLRLMGLTLWALAVREDGGGGERKFGELGISLHMQMQPKKMCRLPARVKFLISQRNIQDKNNTTQPNFSPSISPIYRPPTSPGSIIFQLLTEPDRPARVRDPTTRCIADFFCGGASTIRPFHRQ